MKKIPKIIAVDLDGTVFGADHRAIPPYTAQVLREYIDRGAMLIPVTGRSKAIIPIDAFPPLRYLICANGGYICDLQTEEVLRRAYVAREHVQTAWDTIRDRVEKLNVVEAMEQSIRDSERMKDGIPALFHRRNRKPWLVTMRLEDWVTLYKEVQRETKA